MFTLFLSDFLDAVSVEESKYVGGCMGNNMSNRTLTLQDARKLSTHCTALTCDAKKGKGQVDISLYCDRDLKWFHQVSCLVVFFLIGDEHH